MEEIRCDKCTVSKKLAEYENGIIYIKCKSDHRNSECKKCNRIKQINVMQLMNSTSEYLV